MTATYTTPRTWVAGEVVTATLMNTHVRDNSDYAIAIANAALALAIEAA